MDFSNDLSKSVSVDNDNDEDDDDIQFIGEKSSSENLSHPVQSGETGEHEHSSVTTAKFRCQICKESQTSFVNLHKHLKNVHNATIKLTCNLCGKTFNENRSLIAHIEDHKTKRSNFSESKSKSKRKKSASKSKPKAKRAKRTRKSKNKTEKSTCFTKGKRQRGAASREQAKKSKIGEAEEITSSSSVESDKTNDGSKDRPSTEISIPNDMSPPPPSPSPVSPPQNPSGEDDWGWDTDPRLPQPELSTTLELQPPPDSSSLSLCVPVITTSPKSSADADLPEHAVFEDYFEPLSPKLEVFDDWDGEDDVSNSATVDNSPISHNVSENPSPFPFQCSKCDLEFRTSDLLEIHQSFHDLLVYVKFRCEVSSCFQYFDDEVDYQTHFTSSHTKSRSRCHSSRKRKRPFNIRRQATIPCKYCSKKSRSDSEAVTHEATHSLKEPLKELKTPNAKAVQSYTKLCFVDEESEPELEDPVEDPLMLIESITESDTEPEAIETNADPGPGPGPGPEQSQDGAGAYSDDLDGELYPSSVEESQSVLDKEPSVATQTPTPTPTPGPVDVEPPRNELSPHLVDGTLKIMTFNCVKCDKVFLTRGCLLKHLTYHKQIPRYVCSVCGKAFKFDGLRERHMKIHTAKKIFTCPVAECSMTFITSSAQGTHTRSHRQNPNPPSDDSVKPLPKLLKAPENGICSYCNSRFGTESELAEHKAAHHTGSHPFPCPEPECHKSFTGRAPLKRHLKEVHATLKPFSCPLCDKKYPVKYYLQKHILSHPEHHTHRCPVCEKPHQCQARLKRHMETHSRDPKSFCALCRSQFDTESELEAHKAAHHTGAGAGSRPFPCPKCDKRFMWNWSLGRHLKEVHSTDKPFPCPLCADKQFPSKQRLAQHLLSHPEHNAHRCPICGKPHLTTARLKEHIPSHSSSSDPKDFLCPVPNCTKAYGTTSQLQRHIRESHGAPNLTAAGNETGKEDKIPPAYKCEFCHKNFYSELKFLKHGKLHAQKPLKDNPCQTKFSCESCDVTFTTHLSWVRHKVKHDSNTENLCNFCGRLFPTAEALGAHKKTRHSRRTEYQAKGDRTICDVCGKSFGRRALKAHMDRHSEVPLICDVCGKPCKHEVDLKFHKNTHLPEKPLKCKFCPYRYNQPTSIYSHMQFHHTGPGDSGFVESPLAADLERSFPCDTDGCCRSFTSLPCLKQHQLYHTGDKVFPCKQCGEKFVAKWEVYIHKQEVHKKRFECEYCQKICLNAKFLEEHVRYNHTLEEPFPCTAPDCDRKFKGKSDLKYHMIVAHTGEYKFECEVCGKKFATRGNYNTHMRVHTLTKDFRCEEDGCEASFKGASLLTKHLYKEHGRTDLAAAFLRRGPRIQRMN